MKKSFYKKIFIFIAFIITLTVLIITIKYFLMNISEEKSYCDNLQFEQNFYIICQIDPQIDDVQIFLNDTKGKPYNNFMAIEKALNHRGKKLSLAVNAGMFHKDYSPVGLYVENGKQLKQISTSRGFGNFFLKPNGVFFIKDKKAAILDTNTFINSNIKPDLATQSGPMLVINDKIHPRFLKDSHSLKYRNGVGVKADGKIMLVNSRERVTFHAFARVFQQALDTRYALYLDGTISSLYAPEFNMVQNKKFLGPIVGVVVDK